MQAVTITTYGDPEGMDVVELPEPEPAPGEVLVRAEAIGVGGVDAVIRRGTLGSGFPSGYLPGSEVAGRVVALGPGVDPHWHGRRVWAFTGVGGAYAELSTAAVSDVTPLPDDLDAVDAVALGSSAAVARFALERAHLEAGERVMVRGAAGSIGISAVQLAAAAGAGEVAVTSSNPDRGERLRALGASRVLDRSGAAADEDEGGGTPEGYDVILDIVGGPDLPSFLDRLAPNGRMVMVGIVGGYPPADFGTALLRWFQRSLTFSTLSLDTITAEARGQARAELFAEAARGGIRAVVHDVVPLAEAASAHRRMDDGEVFGRIVLTPPGAAPTRSRP